MSLTPRGKEVLSAGLPEHRLLDAIRARGPLTMDVVNTLGLRDEERSAAIGILRRRGLLADGVPLRFKADTPLKAGPLPEELVLRQISNGETELDAAVVEGLERRGLARTDHRSIKRWAPSDEGRRIALVEEGRGAPRRAYSRAPDERRLARTGVPTRTTCGRRSPWSAALGRMPTSRGSRSSRRSSSASGSRRRRARCSRPSSGTTTSCSCPRTIRRARSTTPSRSKGSPGTRPPATSSPASAAVHEGRPLPGDAMPVGPGWPRRYNPAIAARPVLRSQTTAVSARFLARHPAPPFRMYSIDRNFRREEVDAQHHLEFQQAEGIVGAEGMTIRHLVGLFRSLAEAIGIRELKIRPSYFPFTEPSIEGYVRHPRLGWMEVFPGGLFRPEVLRPLGIDVPVLAWGVGITRLAMVALGTQRHPRPVRGRPGRPRGQARIGRAAFDASPGRRVLELLPEGVTDATLDDLLFASKAEVESTRRGRAGDLRDPGPARPALRGRPGLLSPGGAGDRVGPSEDAPRPGGRLAVVAPGRRFRRPRSSVHRRSPGAGSGGGRWTREPWPRPCDSRRYYTLRSGATAGR